VLGFAAIPGAENTELDQGEWIVEEDMRKLMDGWAVVSSLLSLSLAVVLTFVVHE